MWLDGRLQKTKAEGEGEDEGEEVETTGGEDGEAVLRQRNNAQSQQQQDTASS